MRSSGATRLPVAGSGWPGAWRAAAWRALQQAAAAAVAWSIAFLLLGTDSPLFAPIAAVVGLNATIGRRGSNAVKLLGGVVVGVVVGELAVVVAGGGGLWPLTGATFTAILVAQLLGGAPIVRAQAGVAAILITAFGDPAEGLQRLVGALIGGGVALVFSQLVFSPDPLRLLRRAETAVLTALADGLELTADALERDEPALAEQALTRMRGLRDRLSDVDTMRKASGRVVRHSLTWRSKEVLVTRERKNAEQLELLAASSVMLTRTATAASAPEQAALAPRVRGLARATAELAEQPADRATGQRATEQAFEVGRSGVEHTEAAPVRPAMVAADAAVRMVAFDLMVFAGVEPAEAREMLHESR